MTTNFVSFNWLSKRIFSKTVSKLLYNDHLLHFTFTFTVLIKGSPTFIIEVGIQFFEGFNLNCVTFYKWSSDEILHIFHEKVMCNIV